MARIRTFIAVAIDKAIRDRAIALQESLGRAGADVKWVEPENMHVTLLFLGEVEDRTVPAVCRVVADVAAGLAPFDIRVEGAGCFPSPRRPRTLWVGIGEGVQELVALHDALELPLLDLGCYRREERKYTPHLTLGRVKGETGAQELMTALARRTDWQGGQVRVSEVLVMSSDFGLRPGGPTYTVLGRGKLGG